MKEEKLTELKIRIDELEKRISSLEEKKPTQEFTEYNGILFKRNFDGTWAEVAFCPNCKLSANILPNRTIKCKCGWCVRFDHNSIKVFLDKLPK